MINKATVIMCTLNEENSIERSLSSIKNQSYPNYDILVADSGSTDSTTTIASRYADKIINCPKGKLTSRNIATRYATGDIIVSVDADCYYPAYWLYNLLNRFADNNIVGVSGRTIHRDPVSPFNELATMAEDIDMKIHINRMPGRNCAYLKDAFYKVGDFNDKIDQTDILQMVNEEELGFGNRLAQIGRVVYEPLAECYHYHEKIICRILPKLQWQDGVCKGVGTETF